MIPLPPRERHVSTATLARLAISCGLLACASAAVAQSDQPTGTQSTDSKPADSKPADSTPANADPTLDELLGLPDATPRPSAGPGAAPGTEPSAPEGASTAPVAPSPSNLDRHLSPDQPEQDPFKIAVQLMDASAKRLAPAVADAGLDTQRLQEEAILRLDQLIAQARKQRGQQKPKPNQQQQQQQQQPQNQQQDASSQRAQQNTPSSQAAQDTQSGPAGQQPQTRTPPAGAGAAWGNLPDHVRDALLQGSSDRFSSTYRGLTEEYYKRLAQDPSSRANTPTSPRSQGQPQPEPQPQP